MKVVFRTNVDHYQKPCFPINLDAVPRKGDDVAVTGAYKSYYESQKLPTVMEVVNVTWGESGVICELWYKKIDIEYAKLSNIKLF